jgi:type IV secretion system protein VirB9
VIVHRVSRRLIVRRGSLTGCVVNAAFGGASGRTSSGTVTPAVERVTRSPRP